VNNLVHVLFCLMRDFVRYFTLPEIKLCLDFEPCSLFLCVCVFNHALSVT
jgi:hypothetical protein